MDVQFVQPLPGFEKAVHSTTSELHTIRKQNFQENCKQFSLGFLQPM